MKTNKLRNFFLLFFLTSLTSIIYSQTTFTNLQYAEALQKSILFYEAQQSGKLPSFNRVSWRADSALNDGKDVGKDLTGGWYDAGDHVKFGLPMAYSATMLGWGIIEFKSGYEKSGQLTAIKNNLRFVCDYFIKCHTAPNELYGQVGNGQLDHQFWGAPEIMQMQRPAYKIDTSKPGTELAMETASALAVGSIIFAEADPTYSATLLKHAKELYDFGDKYRGVYSESISDAAQYYRSFSGYKDELVWGALWLYRATNDKTYLDSAEAAYNAVGNEGQTTYKPYKYGMAWDDVIYGCYPLLAKFTGNAKYYADMERNLDYWTDGFNGEKLKYTPGGLAFLSNYGSLRYSCNTAFMATVYGELPNANATKKTRYKNFAVSQVNYALGNNPSNRSYMCGFGNNPPKNPHHRGAHGAWNDNLTGPPTTSRHTLYGALVGGPGNNDDYVDDRGNYVTNEVATDYNAGITGVLAKILSDGTTVSPAVVPNETVGEEYIASIKSNSSGSNYFEPAINIYNHTAWPARIPKKLSFRYFIDISEGIARGFGPNDYALKLNYAPDATLLPGLRQWSGSIYYAEIEYNNALFYPGGQSPSRRECQIRITGPATAWDASNDFSNSGITSTDANTLNIPIYENGVKVYGNEPGGVITVNYTINASAGSNGSISPSGAISVSRGNNKTFTITPNSGYQVDDVLVNGISVGAVTSYTFNNVLANQTIAATFKVILTTNYTIIASAGANGGISPNGSVSVTGGTNKTFNITPNNGYQIDVVKVNGTSVGAVATYTFNNVTANQTIEATFKAVVVGTSTITASVVGGNGTISPTGAVSVTNGTNKTFTITPNSGYQIDAVKVNGTSVGAVGTYTFNNVISNQTIVASFKVVATGGNCLLDKYGVPRAAALPDVNNLSYNKVYTLGTGAPNLSNVTNAVLNWSLSNNGLWQLSFNTNNGVPTWWLDMRNSVQNFKDPRPAITFNGTGIANLDGNKYYINIVDTNNIIFVEVAGKHAIYFSNNNTPPAGCTTARLSSIVENKELKVYPNPANDFVIVDVSGTASNKQIVMYDITGRIVLQKNSNVNTTQETIDISKLPVGLYKLIFKSDDQALTKSLMKQ
jgi:hypothetical protein